MFGLDSFVLYKISFSIIPVILAITLHEAAHGWIAKLLGDPTAFKLGRVTANPIKHIDPVGTILVPIVLGSLSGGALLFGWAKPVPVVFQNLRNPRRDMVLVAAAGPLSNFAMALAWVLLGIVFWAVGAYNLAIGGWLLESWEMGILINTILMVVNLIPIPPLDGSGALPLILPERWTQQYQRLLWGQPGLAWLGILIAWQVFGAIFRPVFLFAVNLIYPGVHYGAG